MSLISWKCYLPYQKVDEPYMFSNYSIQSYQWCYCHLSNMFLEDIFIQDNYQFCVYGSSSLFTEFSIKKIGFFFFIQFHINTFCRYLKTDSLCKHKIGTQKCGWSRLKVLLPYVITSVTQAPTFPLTLSTLTIPLTL